MSAPKTLYDKIWDDHLVANNADGTSLIYIDRHLVHEVTSPQAFEGLRLNKPQGARIPSARWRWSTTTCRPPTARCQSRSRERDCRSRRWPRTRATSASSTYDAFDKRQGIVHIVGPEQGFTLPGMTIVCGDSHTSTHGAFGALAHGIGTSEVEHVLATQTLIQQKAKNMRVTVDGAAAARRHRQGHHPRDHRRDRHRRRHRPRARICRRGDPRAVDGRPHDGLQHVDRGRRPRRHDRAGREDLRVREGPAAGAEGRGLRHGAAPTGRRCSPTTARISTRKCGSTRRSCRRS